MTTRGDAAAQTPRGGDAPPATRGGAAPPHARPQTPLRVLVDATMLDGEPSGAATRLAALGAAHAARGVVEVLHLVRPDSDPLPGLQCVPWPRMHTPLLRALSGGRLEHALATHGAALLQAGALPLPRVRTAPLLLTLHDLRFLQPDADVSRPRRFWARHRLRANLQRAQRIVAVSRSTADEVIARGLLPADRVAVVADAHSPGLQRVQDPAAIMALRRRLQWNARYVLAIGPLARHKRPLFLLDALLAARARPLGADLGLVLAGRAEPERALVFAQRARALGLADCVRLTGTLQLEELAAALSGADALVVASTCEGFCIPVVDAQRLGVPVVGVAAGALPETAGSGAWLVAPDDAAAFGAALVDAVTPDSERDRRVAHARTLAQRWSWERSAQALEALWLSLLSAPREAASR